MGVYKPGQNSANLNFPQSKLCKVAALGIDLGALQADFTKAAKTLHAASERLSDAQDKFDAAKAEFNSARDRLSGGMRTILSGE